MQEGTSRGLAWVWVFSLETKSATRILEGGAIAVVVRGGVWRAAFSWEQLILHDRRRFTFVAARAGVCTEGVSAEGCLHWRCIELILERSQASRRVPRERVVL